MPKPRLPDVDGRRQRWAEHNAERRRHLLDAAVAIIEDNPAGFDVHVQHIAARAGVGRTVVYRHFSDKAELNRAVQAHIVQMLRERVEEELRLRDSPLETIEAIVGAYVGWVAEHPQLHAVAERELGDGRPGELSATVDEIRDILAGVLRAAAQVLGVDLTEAQLVTLDLLVVGLIGQVRGTVSQWVRTSHEGLSAGALTRLLSQWIWFQIDGQARQLGVVLDPVVPLESQDGPAPGRG